MGIGMNGNEWELLITMELKIWCHHLLHGNLPIACQDTNVTARSAQSRISQPRASQLKGTPRLTLLGFLCAIQGITCPKIWGFIFFIFFYVAFGLRFRDFGIFGLTVCWERMHGNVVNLTLVQSTNVKNWWIEPYNSGVDWARDDLFNLDFKWF